ncbi:MAG: hypothetical protein II228_05170, partial [Alistipes sp.]|nr:hypothetical protein [Alistipes sp.]
RPVVGRGCCFTEGAEGPEAFAKEGCFKLHEENWLEEYPQHGECDIFEVRFKNTRRGFYQNVNNLELKRGDIVAVEAAPGHDIGIISLTGDMVRKQMRRTGFNPQNGEFRKIYRKAKPYDIERWQEAIALEHETMILSRQIAADMGLNMKIGDVEYQGDKIKAIFYYIADERVDFRELIKVFAERFHIRIEMKQIGARQEAGRIGGLGACGRELCCASWMSTFSSVTTGAARAQDLSLNPQKLAGQCSKLKCCMMYEYDAYADARKALPRVREPLQTVDGEWFLVKTDILAGLMTFSSSKDTMSNLTTLTTARVEEIQAANRAGKRVEQLQDADEMNEVIEEPTYRSEEDSITRFDKAKRRKKKNNKKSKGGEPKGEQKQEQKQEQKPKQEQKAEPKPKQEQKAEPKAEQSAQKSEPKPERKGEQRPERKHKQRGERPERGERTEQTAEAKPAEQRAEGEEQHGKGQHHRRPFRRRRPQNQGGNNQGGNSE